jgi:hydrogenase assembly chaperone HypC/HupF
MLLPVNPLAAATPQLSPLCRRLDMCLATPMQVTKLDPHKAQVASKNHTHWVNIDLLKDIKKGDWLLVHGDMAIQRLDRKTASEMMELQKKMDNV